MKTRFIQASDLENPIGERSKYEVLMALVRLLTLLDNCWIFIMTLQERR